MQFFRELPEGTACRSHTQTSGTTKDTKITKNKKGQIYYGDKGEIPFLIFANLCAFCIANNQIQALREEFLIVAFNSPHEVALCPLC
jgi:hypothetical protein